MAYTQNREIVKNIGSTPRGSIASLESNLTFYRAIPTLFRTRQSGDPGDNGSGGAAMAIPLYLPPCQPRYGLTPE